MFKASTGKGYQPKFNSSDGAFWYKKDVRGGEALVEVLVSTFLRSCLNLTSYDYTLYDFDYS